MFSWTKKEMDVVSHNTEGLDRERILFLASDDDIQQKHNNGIIIKNDLVPVYFTDYMVSGSLLELSMSVLHTLSMEILCILLFFFSIFFIFFYTEEVFLHKRFYTEVQSSIYLWYQ